MACCINGGGGRVWEWEIQRNADLISRSEMSMTRTECSMEIDEFYHCHRCVQPSCWLIRGYLISCSFIIYKTKLAYSPLFVSISLNLKYEFEELGKFIGYFGVFVCVCGCSVVCIWTMWIMFYVIVYHVSWCRMVV